MLFQKLYNWIRYKSLPTSVLFKNRLFLERDSKNKRIFTNFGLIFRNSKWTNFEISNMKFKFKYLYLKYFFSFFSFLFFLFLLINFNKYYIISFFFNNVIYIFWISVDSVDYYFSFMIWIITILNSLLINFLYTFFFYNNFSINKKNEFFFYNNFFYQSNIKFTKKNNFLFINKNDLNWFMYLWLKNNNYKLNDFFVENLYNNNIFKNWWIQYYNYFINLYKLTYLFNLLNNSNSINNLNLIFNFFIKNDNKTSFNKNNEYLNYYLYYNLKFNKNYFNNLINNSNSLYIYKNDLKWNIFKINLELKSYNYLINFKNNFFFFNDLNFNLLNYLINSKNEFINIYLNLLNQINYGKLNRWLYRYSILHRKILKNSHKITLSKKLINNGFYNSNIFNKNIWTTNLFLKFNNSTFLNSIYNLYNLTKFTNSSNLFIFNLNSLNTLNFYENSFFFSVKRYFFFNNFFNNNLNTSIFVNNFNNHNDKKLLENKFIKFNILINQILNVNFVSEINYDFNLINKNWICKKNNFINNFLIKDIFLTNNDNELLNKTNLNNLYLIIFNNKNTNLLFYNYMSNCFFFIKFNKFYKENYFYEKLFNYFYLINNKNLITNYKDLSLLTKI